MIVDTNPPIPSIALSQTAANILQLGTGSGATTNLRFSKISHLAEKRNELGVFTVDDDKGTINGIAPSQNGYLGAVLNRAQIIFSALGSNPTDLQLDNAETRHLSLATGAKLGFYLVESGSTEDLNFGSTKPSVLFSFPSTNQGFENAKFTQTSNIARIAWEDITGGGDRDFNDLVVEVEAVATPIPLGSSLQSAREIIDLQSVNNQTVRATFSVQQDAGNKNHVSFYKIEDAQGTIIAKTGAVLKPGSAGYLEAAIQNRLTNVDLIGVNGQTIVSSSNIQGGAIYAPLLISNHKPDSANLDFSNVYTAYSAANTDKIDHIRLLGDNTFGFEDFKGGGDRDFNDTIVKANFTIVTTPPQSPKDLVMDIVKLDATVPDSSSVQLNLTNYAGQPLKADIVTNSNAAYQNNIGFYAVEDSIGTIKLTNGTSLKPGDANYAAEAIKNALTNSLQAGKNDRKLDLNITGGKIYAPVIVAQGTLNDFITKNPTNSGGANDIHAYFNYVGANADKVNHFRLIGDNTFGVEDMYGGGDKDFNDLVVSMKVKSV